MGLLMSPPFSSMAVTPFIFCYNNPSPRQRIARFFPNTCNSLYFSWDFFFHTFNTCVCFFSIAFHTAIAHVHFLHNCFAYERRNTFHVVIHTERRRRMMTKPLLLLLLICGQLLLSFEFLIFFLLFFLFNRTHSTSTVACTYY